MWTSFMMLMAAIAAFQVLLFLSTSYSIKAARSIYLQHLRGSDVNAACEAGKQYYKTLRGGCMTEADHLEMAKEMYRMNERLKGTGAVKSIEDIALIRRSLN